MEFALFLRAIGAATRLDISAAKQAGGCSIVFSETMEVTFEYDANSQVVQLYAGIISLGESSLTLRAHILANVLQLHLFGLATDGNYFGFDPALERLVFFRSIALAELTPQQAVQSVESFVNQLERWQIYLVRLSAQQVNDQKLLAEPFNARQSPLMRA